MIDGDPAKNQLVEPPTPLLYSCVNVERNNSDKINSQIRFFFSFPETHHRAPAVAFFSFSTSALFLVGGGRGAEEAPSYSKKRVERNAVAMSDRADQLGPEQPLSGS